MYLSMHASEVAAIGTTIWPEPAWSMTTYGGGSKLLTSLLAAGDRKLARAMCGAELELRAESKRK